MDKRQVKFDKKNKKDMDAFYSNYGLFLKVGGLYVSKWVSGILLLFTSHQIIMGSVSAYYARGDSALFFESINAFIVTMTVTLTIIIFSKHKDKYEYLWSCLGQNRHQYEIDEESLNTIEKMRRESEKKKHFGPRVFTCSAIAAIVCHLIIRRPLDIYLNDGHDKYGRFSPDMPENFVGGIPVPYWTYLDVEQDFFYFFAAVAEYIFIVLAATIIAAGDNVFMSISYELCTEYKILHFVLRNLTKMSWKVCKESKQKVNSEMIKPTLKRLVNSSIQHHQQLIQMTTTLSEINRYLLMYYFLGMGIIICMSGVLLQSPSVTYGTKMAALFSCGAEIYHFFIYCWFSEKFKTLSGQVGQEIYTAEIMKYNVFLKGEIMIVLMRSQKPVVMSVNAFGEMNLQAFGSIMQSAYSYFNFIVAANEKTPHK